MKGLLQLTKVVQKILESRKSTRNSDTLLYVKVLEEYSSHCGYSMDEPIGKFLRRDFHKEGIPTFESIGRCRRKVQENCPELKASATVRDLRNKQQDLFIEYAITN